MEGGCEVHISSRGREGGGKLGREEGSVEVEERRDGKEMGVYNS